MSDNPLLQLINFGQSVWYDNISRDLLDNGKLAEMISTRGLRGVTSNPTIFDNAIGSSDIYDAEIAKLKAAGMSAPDQVFEELAIADIGAAADIFRKVYDESNGDDGFVSIEVSPLLARDTQGSIDEAVKLYDRLNRPNIMIKIPGTEEGLPAVYELLKRGISVNITLLFSVENYVAVANTYCKALNDRLSEGLPIDKVRSVASFFVSRVETIIDSKLDELGPDAAALKGQFAVANSKVAYQRYKDIFLGESFANLKSNGAAPQRPLWASTSTKNPIYRDVVYVEELIGPDTVNTMPPATVEAFADHGVVANTIEKDIETAEALESKLASLGVDVSGALNHLQVEGVEKFSDSFRQLNETLSKKL